MHTAIFKKIDSSQPNQAQELARLNFFLKQHKESKAAKGDLNFYLAVENNIIACARLIEAENGYWLRGVFVTPEHRKKGIGSHLMQKIHETLAIQTMVYAFPLGHLNDFYNNLGYSTCDIKAFPKELRTRYEKAQKQNKGWLAMIYQS